MYSTRILSRGLILLLHIQLTKKGISTARLLALWSSSIDDEFKSARLGIESRWPEYGF